MLLNSSNTPVEQKDNPLPLLFVWHTHYKPQAKKFYEMPKIISFLKAESHNPSLEIDVKNAKLVFIKAEIFLISPCNNFMTLSLSEPQYFQLKIITIILKLCIANKKNAMTAQEYWNTTCGRMVGYIHLWSVIKIINICDILHTYCLECCWQ